MSELDVLLEQLEEMLGEGAMDWDDALEIATVAGLAARLGAEGGALEEAEVWRDEDGRELIDEAFEEVDLDELVAAIDGVLRADATEEEVEEALYEFDDLVAAAVWSGHRDKVLAFAKEVARTIRDVPEPFATIADYGATMARTPPVTEDLELYDYWLAVADAAHAKEEQDPGDIA